MAVISTGALVTVFASAVAVFLVLAPAGARFVAAFTRLVPAVLKDDAALGNLVMVFKKIGSLKIAWIQSVSELVRRATQRMSLPLQGWHWPCRGLSLPARGSSLSFPRSR